MGAVKSVYFSTLELKLSSSGTPSQTNNKWWQHIWSLSVPANVKNFLWRASNNYLLTIDNLHLRKVTPNSTCPIWKQEKETFTHMIRNYSVANDVWANSTLITHKWPRTMLDFSQIWDKFSGLEQSTLEKAAIIMSFIWLRRNEFVFQSKLGDPNRLV